MIERSGLGSLAPPVVIGATGGSGTRALVPALEELGVFMGREQNAAGDAMAFEPALDAWINPILRQTRSVRYAVAHLPDPVARKAALAFLDAAARHLRGLPPVARHWGFKNPRQIFMLPLLADLFPGFRFIHLVRDGRDMALSSNRNQLNKHYKELFGKKPPSRSDRGAIELWSTVNTDASIWAKYTLGENYLPICFEQLCKEPETHIQRISDFLGSRSREGLGESIERAAQFIQTPSSIGRWTALDAVERRRLSKAGAKGLRYFNYTPAPNKATPDGCLVVLGMHRGGTSAVSGLLASGGREFGVGLMQPGPDNPEGYWENERLVAVSHQIFSRAGREWWDPDAWTAPHASIPDHLRLSAESEIVAALGGLPRPAVKDPRMTPLARFWLPTIRKALGVKPRVILVLRHPLACAASLEKRDGLDRNAALWLWINHMRIGEAASRGYERLIVNYDDVIDGRDGERLRQFAGLAPATSAAVRQDLRHHSGTGADDAGAQDPAQRLSLDMYEALKQLGRADDRNGRARLSRLAKKADAMLGAVSGVVAHTRDRATQAVALAETYRTHAASNQLRAFRQKDVLRHLPGETAQLQRGWEQKGQSLRARRRRRGFFDGYSDWLKRYETGPEALQRLSSFLDSQPPLPTVGYLGSHHGDDLGDGAERFSFDDLLHDSGDGIPLYILAIRPGYAVSPGAIEKLLAATIQFPDARMFYGDEDRVSADGERVSPWFKPGIFDPLDHLQRDLLGGVVLIHRSVFAAYQDARDVPDPLHRLAARLAADQGSSTLCHLPSVLSSLTHAALDANALTQRARDRLLSSQGCIAGDAFGEVSDTAALVRLRFPMPEPAPKVSILIPTRDGGAHLERCLNGLRLKTAYPNVEIIVVDNGSTEKDTLLLLKAFEASGQGKVIRYDAPFNYPELNHIARMEATGHLLCLLNDDVEPIGEDWLRELVSLALLPDTGVAGALLLQEDGTIQHAGVVIGMDGGAGAHYLRGCDYEELRNAGIAVTVQQFSAVTAACVVMRADVYDEMGGMDLHHLPVNYNDVDFCLRLTQAGLKVLMSPHARLWHLESATRGKKKRAEVERQWRKDVEVMKARWQDGVATDPWLSPNLNAHTTRPVLSFPPSARRFWEQGTFPVPEEADQDVAHTVAFTGIPAVLALYHSAEMLAADGLLEPALRMLRKAVDILPDEPRMLAAAGVIQKRLGHVGRAEHVMRRLVRLHPTMASGWYNLGNLFLDSDRLEEAVRCYNQVVRLVPAHLNAAINLSIGLGRLERFDEALDTMDRALSLFPGNPKILAQMGVLFLRKGDAANAVHCFRAAAGGAPNDPAVWFNLGTALRQAGKPDEAVGIYRDAIPRFGAPPNAIANYARSLIDVGRAREALESLKPFAGKEETGENIQETFADAAFSCGDWRDGLFALHAARRARSPGLSAAPAHRGIPTQAVIDGRGSGLTLLALTNPLIRFGRALGHHAPGWQVIVEPQLVRFTSLATGRMRVTTDDPVDRGPIFAAEALPELLDLSGCEETPFQISASLAECMPGSPPTPSESVMVLMRDRSLLTEEAAGDLRGFLGQECRDFQTSDVAETAAMLQMLDLPSRVAVRYSPWPWDALDRYELIRPAARIVTDCVETAFLSALAEREVFLFGAPERSAERLLRLPDISRFVTRTCASAARVMETPGHG